MTLIFPSWVTEVLNRKWTATSSAAKRRTSSGASSSWRSNFSPKSTLPKKWLAVKPLIEVDQILLSTVVTNPRLPSSSRQESRHRFVRSDQIPESSPPPSVPSAAA